LYCIAEGTLFLLYPEATINRIKETISEHKEKIRQLAIYDTSITVPDLAEPANTTEPFVEPFR
jgi:hypothetical protein